MDDRVTHTPKRKAKPRSEVVQARELIRSIAYGLVVDGEAMPYAVLMRTARLVRPLAARLAKGVALMWYVIQVVGGREETAKRLIDKLVDEESYREVFVPRYRATRKVDGVWEYYHPVLTPGYVIVDTTTVNVFEAQLRRVPAFMRLLGSDERFKPLDREERAWLEEWTQPDDRVVQGSIGRIDKGRLKILSGPLIGREADVVRFNRRRRKAVVRMTFMGRVKEIELELEIVGKTSE